MQTKKTIFITGITGNQGNAVARHTMGGDYHIIGLTRNANSPGALQLKEEGITIIEGDLDHPSSYQTYLDKADAVYLVQALQQKDREVAQGKTFVDALKGQHLVYASVLGADLQTGVPHFDSKFELENYIKSKNLKYTILRPASFYENHLFPRVANDIRKGKYVSPLVSACRQQMIGLDDIGKIAASVIANKDNYEQKTLSIATDEQQIGEIPEIFAEALGRSIKYKKLPGFIARLAMGRDLSKMFAYMNKHDFKVIDNIPDLRQEFAIKGDFRDWVHTNFGRADN